MKKTILIAIVLLTILTGCTKEKMVTSKEQAKQIAKNYIETSKEYKETNGYHLEEINTLKGECDNCYTVQYEFRLREEDNATITDVMDVEIQIKNGEITKKKFMKGGFKRN